MRRYLSLIAVGMLLATTAEAQNSGFMGADQDNNWSLSVYMWGAGMKGTVGLGPLDVPVDASFSDILDNLEMAVFGHLEYNADNNFGVFADTMYIGLGSNVTTERGNGSASVDMDMLVVEGAVSYNLGSREAPFNLFAGLRYWDVEMSTVIRTVVPETEIRPSGGADWTDFMVGARWAPRLGEKWWALLRADIAFGDSDTYNLSGALVWRFARSASMPFGYRYMDLDYDKGTDLQRRALDIDMSGPFLAIEFSF